MRPNIEDDYLTDFASEKVNHTFRSIGVHPGRKSLKNLEFSVIHHSNAACWNKFIGLQLTEWGMEGMAINSQGIEACHKYAQKST